jgi:hypothetical protein
LLAMIGHGVGTAGGSHDHGWNVAHFRLLLGPVTPARFTATVMHSRSPGSPSTA